MQVEKTHVPNTLEADEEGCRKSGKVEVNGRGGVGTMDCTTLGAKGEKPLSEAKKEQNSHIWVVVKVSIVQLFKNQSGSL